VTDGAGTSPIRDAAPEDVPAILGLIRELAEYERAADQVVAMESDLARWLFGPDRMASALVAEVDGEVVGFALWFLNFSTWLGLPGIYLEDLYVRPGRRGTGLGRALLLELVAIARQRGYGRVEWSVLDWNTPAIGFYRALGARPMDDWTTWRLDGHPIRDGG
jgi:GNAT superfamily N-acetyltransferase